MLIDRSEEIVSITTEKSKLEEKVFTFE